ncbi:MAG: outer membrane lipoprotein-sorting protein [Candidatus Aminicenantes bacterium]|nr:outer membrane lipoprotein-sorting protein [Candidatus Aminicenantes bacterium]MBL7083853.1 outer membrane lipoprotein-sorting protein [Candidatus Aminicenantes bacterium]
MKKILSFCLLSFFLLSLLTSPGYSQKASDILDKMIDAQGGKKVLGSIKDTTISGSLEMIAVGASGSVTIYHKEPNKVRMDMEMMGMVITVAFDGETAWMINPQTGSTEEMSGKDAEDMKRDVYDFGYSALLYPEKYSITYAYKGKEKIEGKDYFVLEQIFSDGHKKTLYIDSKTYLTFKIKDITLNDSGVEVEEEEFRSDYKKVDGVMFPHSITSFEDGGEAAKVTVTNVKFNTGLENSLFEMSK